MGGMLKGAMYALILGFIATMFLDWSPPSLPNLPETTWTNDKDRDQSIKPFKISFKEKDVQDLLRRLRETRHLRPPLENVGWTYGTNANYLRAFIDYWLSTYAFNKSEVYLNQFPQFTTKIQGLNMHYLHVKPQDSEGKRVVPILLLHGWPGSFAEFYKVLPILTKPQPNRDFVFEAIVPSLPGFGFSSGATKPGLGAVEMTLVMKNLMSRIGFEQFYVQGGDWGSVIASGMSALYPENVLGLHSNRCNNMRPLALLEVYLYSFFPSLLLPKEDHHLLYPLSDKIAFMIEETGYFHIQATKPDTIGAGLNDSPAGLAAYILEKFSIGSNPEYKKREDGGVLEKFTASDLIDNLMIYWISNSITTSMRIYAETANSKLTKINLESLPITVPSACAQFPFEISYLPEKILKRRYVNLIRVTKMPRGGHFAAMEEPELLAGDIWASIEAMEALRTKK